MGRWLNSLLCVAIMSASLACAQAPVGESRQNAGNIRQVTLFREGALVTREIVVPPGDAIRSILVPDLPTSIVPDSVSAESADGFVVRSVRVSRRPDPELSREDSERLDTQASALNRQRAETQHALEMVKQDVAALNQLVSFSAAAGKSDLDRGVLNADTLTRLTTFSKTERRELAGELFQHQRQLQELDAQLRQIASKRSPPATDAAAVNYQVRIVLETRPGVAGKVRLNYLVSNCGWAPQYVVRRRAGKENKVAIRYSAVVQQATGEAWKEVHLVLSTASPMVNAARPLLAPLEVTAAERPHETSSDDPFGVSPSRRTTGAAQRAALAEALQPLRALQAQAEAALNDGPFADLTERRDVALNALAGGTQQIELQAGAESWRNLAPDVKDDVATQAYTLPQRTSLETQGDQQLVQILEFESAGELYHVATPLLSTYAYREVQVTNTQPAGLLAGPAMVYSDDRFVGRVELPSTASGQRLTIGLGADLQVRTRRELVDRQETLKGGNRQVTFGYRLVIANFKDQPLEVRLLDRMPHARQSQHLSVKLNDPKTPLSQDALYQRVSQPAGILRWDLSVPADRHGSKAFDVDYSFTIEFDRSRIPTTEHSPDELRAQYESARVPDTMGGGMGGMGGSGQP
jgi:hypothetical protein